MGLDCIQYGYMFYSLTTVNEDRSIQAKTFKIKLDGTEDPIQIE